MQNDYLCNLSSSPFFCDCVCLLRSVMPWIGLLLAIVVARWSGLCCWLSCTLCDQKVIGFCADSFEILFVNKKVRRYLIMMSAMLAASSELYYFMDSASFEWLNVAIIKWANTEVLFVIQLNYCSMISFFICLKNTIPGVLQFQDVSTIFQLSSCKIKFLNDKFLLLCVQLVMHIWTSLMEFKYTFWVIRGPLLNIQYDWNLDEFIHELHYYKNTECREFRSVRLRSCCPPADEQQLAWVSIHKMVFYCAH